MKYDEYVDKFIQEVNPAVLCTDYYAFGNNPTRANFTAVYFGKIWGYSEIVQLNIIYRIGSITKRQKLWTLKPVYCPQDK